jgi:hypothetical protein
VIERLHPSVAYGESVPREREAADAAPPVVHVSIRGGPQISVDDPEFVDW